MADSPQSLTREWFCGGVMSGLLTNANETFTKLADPHESGHLDPELIKADQQKLSAVAGKIEHYVNQHVAHTQANPTASIPTFADLNDAVESLCEMLTKYTLLLTQASRARCEPVFQEAWERTFDRAWSDRNE